MATVTRYQLPSVLLVLNGIYIGLQGAIPYVRHVRNPPSHELGFLAELVFLGFLLVAAGLVIVGVYGLGLQRFAFPLAVLVGIAVLQGTFVFDLYSMRAKTHVVVGLGLLVSIVPAAATYLFVRRSSYFPT